jgi:hypothetical protein
MTNRTLLTEAFLILGCSLLALYIGLQGIAALLNII